VLFQYFAEGFIRHASPGNARVQYSGAGSRNGYALDGLEGYGRTGSLMAPWVSSGRTRVVGTADLLEMLRSGLIAGTDPHSPEYWGEFHPEDQRIVEAADVARIVWMTRSTIWSGLSQAERQNVRGWLMAAGKAATPRSNWMLFPVVIN